MLAEIRMDSVASYVREAKLTTDKKINLIYGLNGTGKSTISNYLYEPDNINFLRCTKKPEPADPILVYNQSFIQDNFHVSDNLKGIFSLSKENKLAEEKIANAEAELSRLEQSQADKRVEKQSATQEFERQKLQAINEIWKIKSVYTGGDRVLEYCLEGLKGKKDKLFAHLFSVPKPPTQPDKTVQAIRDEVEELKDESAHQQPNLPALSFPAITVEPDPIFGEPILGNADSQVAKLIEHLGSADWVKQGLKYIPDNVDEAAILCPFCQEDTITSKLVNQIKGYFDDTYQQRIAYLEKLQADYVSSQNAILNINIYTENPFAMERAQAISIKHKDLIDQIKHNISIIEQKISSPKLPLTLKSTSEALKAFNAEVSAINDSINDYNQRLKNRDSALTSLKKEFWSNMRWQYDQTLSRFDNDLTVANRKLQSIDEELKQADKKIAATKLEIANTQKETVNVDEAVESINKNLSELGIDGFHLKKHSETLYRIVRVGQSEDAFRTLSEGEKMMISFLYFCELCKGKSSATDTNTKRIAVIDDPISSLSHIFIFNVGQLIKTVFFNSEKISQVFVLTHSLYFFYELTAPKHERRKENQKLFRLTKGSDGTEIREMKYEEIQNDYQSYWSVINDPTQPPALIANCMRNIVEYFFNFVRKKDLNNVFLLPQLQEVKYQAFCRYVNRESHSLGQNLIDLKEFDYSTFKDGLRLVFENTGYQDHFKAMSKI